MVAAILHIYHPRDIPGLFFSSLYFRKAGSVEHAWIFSFSLTAGWVWDVGDSLFILGIWLASLSEHRDLILHASNHPG